MLRPLMRRIGVSREGRAAAEDSHEMGDIEKYQMYFYVKYIGEEEIGDLRRRNCE